MKKDGRYTLKRSQFGLDDPGHRSFTKTQIYQFITHSCSIYTVLGLENFITKTRIIVYTISCSRNPKGNDSVLLG